MLRVTFDGGRLLQIHYKAAYHFKAKEVPREHKVRFAVKNSLLKTVEAGRNGSARLLTLRCITTEDPSNLVGASAPTIQL